MAGPPNRPGTFPPAWSPKGKGKGSGSRMERSDTAKRRAARAVLDPEPGRARRTERWQERTQTAIGAWRDRYSQEYGDGVTTASELAVPLMMGAPGTSLSGEPAAGGGNANLPR